MGYTKLEVDGKKISVFYTPNQTYSLDKQFRRDVDDASAIVDMSWLALEARPDAKSKNPSGLNEMGVAPKTMDEIAKSYPPKDVPDPVKLVDTDYFDADKEGMFRHKPVYRVVPPVSAEYSHEYPNHRNWLNNTRLGNFSEPNALATHYGDHPMDAVRGRDVAGALISTTLIIGGLAALKPPKGDVDRRQFGISGLLGITAAAAGVLGLERTIEDSNNRPETSQQDIQGRLKALGNSVGEVKADDKRLGEVAGCENIVMLDPALPLRCAISAAKIKKVASQVEGDVVVQMTPSMALTIAYLKMNDEELKAEIGRLWEKTGQHLDKRWVNHMTRWDRLTDVNSETAPQKGYDIGYTDFHSIYSPDIPGIPKDAHMRSVPEGPRHENSIFPNDMFSPPPKSQKPLELPKLKGEKFKRLEPEMEKPTQTKAGIVDRRRRLN